uniref:Uncharacterized protein n=1 Tax=Roseihalotalea indica TaxID=2867963 RepID=A0AA49GLS5_9BACT|nr:hypothetical protein K4G66_27385 [Tunicatimonas sp. TK19036]
MKTSTTVMLLLLCLFTTTGYSQFLQPVEKKLDIDKKVTPAWVLTVDEPEDALQESIIDYAKQELGVKLKKSKRDLLMAKEVKIPSIAFHTGDLKIQFSNVRDETQVAVAFMPGYDIALNSEENPQEMERLRQFTRSMVKYHKVNNLQQTIDDDEKRLRKLESSLKKNQREYQRLDKRTARMDRQINSSKTDENKKFDLNNDLEEAEDRMATLEDTEGELEDEIAKLNEKIHTSQSAINDIENRFAEATVTTETEFDEEYRP